MSKTFRSGWAWKGRRTAQRGRGVGILLAMACGLSLWLSIPDGSAQKTSAEPRSIQRKRKPKPAPPPIVESAASSETPTQPPPIKTPEQMPSQQPEVWCDGARLSINAENSTLADILVAVHAHTGAVIDVPPGATQERMAARLGPAPVREVLAALLSSTDYDFIIQASDTNADGVQTVILTSRSKADDVTMASASSTSSVVRRMPGYSASGERTQNVPFETGSASPPDTDSTSLAEITSDNPEAGTGTEAASMDLKQEGPVDPPASLIGSAPSPVNAGSATGSVASNSGQQLTIGQMAQDLQQLYQQRRQIQAQQNQTPPPAN